MNSKSGFWSVVWWLGWIAVTVISFFISAFFWTPYLARHVGNMDTPGAPIIWVGAVFGSWMVLLVPLIILMYTKVDKAYEDARIARENAQLEKSKGELKARSVFVEESRRMLKKELAGKLKKYPETIKRGHLVTAILDNGQKIPNVFIRDKKDVLGVYGARTLSFNIQDIVDIEPVALEGIPNFKAEEWLRLDGAGHDA